jgi:hypothetical protein
MKNIKEDISTNPTLSKPVGMLGKGYENNFKKTMQQNHVNLNETDALLNEAELSLKKKIFSLSKMEALVFSDPKLSTVYEEMAENGEERFGYHYNETIMNMLFNDYVLNSPKYLQKYKMSIPQKKKRRDKSGINQLKKVGDINMHKKPVNPIQTTPAVAETTGAASSGAFAGPAAWQKGGDLMETEKVEETTSSSSSGAYVGPAAWGGGDLLKGGKSKAMRKPIWLGGTIIQESNYLTNPSAFAKYADMLNEEVEINPSAAQLNPVAAAQANVSPAQQNNTPPYTNSAINNKIINKTSAFSSDVVKQWNKPDTELELHTINKGTMDELELNSMEEIEVNVPAGAKIYGPDMYSTKEDLKELIARTKERTGKGLQKDQIPMLAGEALYTIAIQLANRMMPISWDEMGDTNSMWDYIDEQGNMSFERLSAAIREAVNDRMSADGMEFGELYEKATSPAQQRLFGMAHAVQKGELSPNKVGGAVKKIAKTVSPKDVTDFASTKYGEMDETMQSIIDDKPDTVAKGTPTGTVSMGNVPVGLVDMKEEMDLLNEIDNELGAYSIHQKKLQQMSEDRKPSSLVLKDRLGAENATNFKKDFANSDTKDVIKLENKWKDQQTDVPADQYKLGEDIENVELKTTKGEAFKNVGNSTNDKGDEVPKRNMTTAEQDEVNIYRKGMHSLNYDNKPDQRFEDRMKADMGDAVYEIREKQMAEFGKAPMYNKEAQPIETTKAPRTEFDREKSGWNDPKGLSESMISGRYRNALNKSKIIDFQLNEVKFLRQTSEKTMEALFPLDFTGLGNTLNGKTTDYKVSVNESVIGVLDAHKFYTDGKQIFAIKNPKQNLSEADTKAKPVVNEEINKMKHLLGYKGTDFVSTTNVKKNRGF